MARALFLSPRTVRSNIEHLLRKTGAVSRAEATVWRSGTGCCGRLRTTWRSSWSGRRPCGSAEGPLGLPFG
ncbi:LuxR C-terminal-related transcriptional regulator [Streptomyces griseorubiginosus]|uniref:LuxR C-terminal-related transcriptional regulator n=1 Tax=Streptomyces griseorubiginosus TaxID=67304 RepID=UPI003646AC63